MKEFLIQCAECGVDVLTDHKNLKYCSKKCSNKRKSRAEAKKKYKENTEKYKDVPDIPTCKICGFKSKNLIPHLKKIHNISAKTYTLRYKDKNIIHQEAVYKKNCAWCGTPFETYKKTKVYCSDECAYEEKKRYNKELHKRKKDPNYAPKVIEKKPKEEKYCAQCGKKLHNRSLKYCDAACKRKYHRQDPSHKEKRLKLLVEKSIEKYKNDPDAPTCKICGFKGEHLTQHLKHYHNMTTSEYKKKYGLETKDIVHPALCRKFSKMAKERIAIRYKQLQNELFKL